jgi:hypothetical protein
MVILYALLVQIHAPFFRLPDVLTVSHSGKRKFIIPSSGMIMLPAFGRNYPAHTAGIDHNR